MNNIPIFYIESIVTLIDNKSLIIRFIDESLDITKNIIEWYNKQIKKDIIFSYISEISNKRFYFYAKDTEPNLITLNSNGYVSRIKIKSSSINDITRKIKVSKLLKENKIK